MLSRLVGIRCLGAIQLPSVLGFCEIPARIPVYVGVSCSSRRVSQLQRRNPGNEDIWKTLAKASARVRRCDYSTSSEGRSCGKRLNNAESDSWN